MKEGEIPGSKEHFMILYFSTKISHVCVLVRSLISNLCTKILKCVTAEVAEIGLGVSLVGTRSGKTGILPVIPIDSLSREAWDVPPANFFSALSAFCALSLSGDEQFHQPHTNHGGSDQALHRTKIWGLCRSRLPLALTPIGRPTPVRRKSPCIPL